MSLPAVPAYIGSPQVQARWSAGSAPPTAEIINVVPAAEPVEYARVVQTAPALVLPVRSRMVGQLVPSTAPERLESAQSAHISEFSAPGSFVKARVATADPTPAEQVVDSPSQERTMLTVEGLKVRLEAEREIFSQNIEQLILAQMQTLRGVVDEEVGKMHLRQRFHEERLLAIEAKLREVQQRPASAEVARMSSSLVVAPVEQRVQALEEGHRELQRLCSAMPGTVPGPEASIQQLEAAVVELQVQLFGAGDGGVPGALQRLDLVIQQSNSTVEQFDVQVLELTSKLEARLRELSNRVDALNATAPQVMVAQLSARIDAIDAASVARPSRDEAAEAASFEWAFVQNKLAEMDRTQSEQQAAFQMCQHRLDVIEKACQLIEEQSLAPRLGTLEGSFRDNTTTVEQLAQDHRRHEAELAVVHDKQAEPRVDPVLLQRLEAVNVAVEAGQAESASCRNLLEQEVQDRSFALQSLEARVRMDLAEIHTNMVQRPEPDRAVMLAIGANQLRVTIRSATTLQQLGTEEWFIRHQLHCVCEIQGKPVSRYQTEATSPSRNTNGDVEVIWKPSRSGMQDGVEDFRQIEGFSYGDKLLFTVYGKESGSQLPVVVGTATLLSREFFADGFEGQLQLYSQEELATAQATSTSIAGTSIPCAWLKVKVVPVKGSSEGNKTIMEIPTAWLADFENRVSHVANEALAKAEMTGKIVEALRTKYEDREIDSRITVLQNARVTGGEASPSWFPRFGLEEPRIAERRNGRNLFPKEEPYQSAHHSLTTAGFPREDYEEEPAVADDGVPSVWKLFGN